MTQDSTPEVEPTTEGTESADEKRSSLLRKAYGAATTRLREQYRTEFDALYSQEAEALGVEYTPRLTAEQKAEQQMQALLAEFPHLAEKVAQQPAG